MRRFIFAIVAIPLAVMLVACGGSSNSNNTSNTTTQPTTAPTSTSLNGSSSSAGVTGSTSTGVPGSSSPIPGTSSTTQTPSASESSGPTGSTGTPSATTITLVAKDLKYDKSEIDAPADTSFTVILDNQDQSVPHNFSVYSGKDLAQKFFTGDLDTGPATKSYTIPPLKAGTYYFRCDVHPDTMNGTLTVK